MTGVYVPGVTGRMGHLIAHAAVHDDQHRLLGATVRPGAMGAYDDVGALLGRGHLELEVKTDLEAAIAAQGGTRGVIIDFTAPAALAGHIDAARRHGFPLLVGTTGLSDDEERALDDLAGTVPVMRAANTSLGANVTSALVKKAAAALPFADVDIAEIHHNQKKDAPSGTALMLGRAVAAARDVSFDERKVLARAGHAPREEGEIGVFGLRGGDVVGEHTVYFFLAGERIEVTHRVTDRGIFARGALFAARFLADQAPGRYTMDQALGL